MNPVTFLTLTLASAIQSRDFIAFSDTKWDYANVSDLLSSHITDYRPWQLTPIKRNHGQVNEHETTAAEEMLEEVMQHQTSSYSFSDDLNILILLTADLETIETISKITIVQCHFFTINNNTHSVATVVTSSALQCLHVHIITEQ